MEPNDPRALALILFQKFHKDLPKLDEEPSERSIKQLVQDALELMPDYQIEPGPRANLLLVRKVGEPPEKAVEFNIQSTLDSLRILWTEYSQNAIQEELKNDGQPEPGKNPSR